jgi:cysteinyl-tRNA synthetase
MLNVPYRQPLNYREELLEQAQNDYEKLDRAYLNLFRKLELSDDTDAHEDEELIGLRDAFIDAMSDDFNTANAITVLFGISRLANALIRERTANLPKMKACLNLFRDMFWILGIEPNVKPLTAEDRDLIRRYQQAKAEKNYGLSDELREIIMAKGINL